MKINVTDTGRLARAIHAVQGGCSARTISDSDIKACADRFTQWLDRHRVPYKTRKGLSCYCDPNAQRFPAAYRFTPYSTRFRLTLGSDGRKAYVSGLGRYITSPELLSIQPTDALREAIVKNACKELAES